MVNVKENLERIQQNIEDLTKKIDDLRESVRFTEEEIERLRGCLAVFKCLDGAGVENIETSVSIQSMDFENNCTKDYKIENIHEHGHSHGHLDQREENNHEHGHSHGHLDQREENNHEHGHSHGHVDNKTNKDPFLKDKPVDKIYQSYRVI